MVKVHTIEMIEHSAKNFPNVTAHTDMVNGAIVGMEDGKTVAPVSGSPIYVVLNTQVGDNEYAESYTIAKDEYVSLYDLVSWKDKELDITDSNIEYADGQSFADLTVGTEMTFDAGTFKFKKGAATSGDVNFTITKCWGSSVNGITVKIGIKE